MINNTLLLKCKSIIATVLGLFLSFGHPNYGHALKQEPDTKIQKFGFHENGGQFIDQHNQANKKVLYGMAIPGMNIGLTKNGFSYTTFTLSEIPENQTSSRIPNRREQQSPKIRTHRIDVVFEGSNSNSIIVSTGALGKPLRYIKGGNNVLIQSYQKVTYVNLYPNIDLEFIANSYESKPVEYNFIVRPGGKLSDIKMRYSGAQSAKLKEGKLVFELAHGSLTESIPASWLQENNEKQDIAYHVLSQEEGSILIQLRNKSENRGLSKTLIVDPVPTLDWSTYFGGFDYESAFHSVLDNKGNVYITGQTYSNSLIHTTGAHQDTLNGYLDAYVAKFSHTGTLKWATYFGGSKSEKGYAGFADEKGNYYFAGSTWSNDMYTSPGAHQSSFGEGVIDAFMAKLDSNGKVKWSTYYGGDGSDRFYGIHGDNQGSIFAVGRTGSTDKIHTTGAQDSVIGNIEKGDGFVVKFNTDGLLQWGTYLGGEEDDFINSCHTDSDGNIICCLSTQSSTGISTVGSHQEGHNNNGYDAAVAKYKSSGVLLWSTYYGGDWNTEGYGCTVDVNNNIIISGKTRATTGIATSGTHQDSFNGGQSGFEAAFLVKFNSDGVRQWGTYAGNNGSTNKMRGQGSVDADALGNIYLGATANFSDTFLHSSDGYKTTTGLGDALLMKFDPNGKRRWGTYFGGEGADEGTSVNVDQKGNIFVVGESVDSGFAARFSTSGAHQIKNNGSDIFVARFTQDDLVLFESDTFACDSITIFGQKYIQNAQATKSSSRPICCDTLYLVNVAMGYSSNETITASACGSYELNGKFYTQTGTYQQVIPNASGCDSTITLNLSITPAGVDAEFAVASQLITNNEVSMVNITQQTPDSMQWIIPTSSSITIKSKTDDELVLEFADSGTYEFGLRTFLGSCSNYSSKLVRVLENHGFDPIAGKNTFVNHFNIFPNPSSNQFTTEVILSAESDIRLRVVDPITNQVLDDQLKTGSSDYSIPYALGLQPGVYIMLLESESGSLIYRFVIQ